MKLGRIYVITNTFSGKIYVGQTWQTLEQRWHQHVKSSVRVHGPRKSPFHCAVQSYGKSVFEIRTVCLAFTQAALDEAERYFIVALSARLPKGYNLSEGGSTSPVKDPDVRAKIAATLTGRKRSAESVANQQRTRSLKKYRHSEETRARMSASQKGRTITPEHRRKLSVSASHVTSQMHTPEANAKRSATLTGHVVSQATRDKIGAKSSQKSMSPDARQRIAESMRALRAARPWSTRRKSS